MAMGESKTRRNLIDKALVASGWSPILKNQNISDISKGAVTEFPTEAGPSDYALVHKGEIIALVEAKKISKGPQSAIEQAKRYSRGIEGSRFNFRGFRVPFVYSTNGKVFYFQDLRNRLNLPRKVFRFHTPSALRCLLAQDKKKALDWFKKSKTDSYGLRVYQREAIEHTENALTNGKQKMMVAMASGTGKTYLAVCQSYRLIKSGFAKKILFLVDRRALAAQAVGTFASVEPEKGFKFDSLYDVYSQRFHKTDLQEFKFKVKAIPEIDLTKPNPNHTFVFVCTIQLMRNLLFGQGDFKVISGDEESEDDIEKIDIPIHAFDVIIADECHRGYTSTEESKWREVLDHFDAIKIGLTATPAMHTKAYFKEIVYKYGIDEAIREGHLVDYDPVRIKSGIQMKGMFLKPGEHVKLVDTNTGEKTYDTLEDERKFPSSAIEKDITAPDMNKKIVDEFGKYALQQEKEFGRFPKTLFFAVNDLEHISHSDRLVNILREYFGRGSDFVQKVTGKVDRPLKVIREFRNRKEPGITVTVDLLTTGVDVPAIENLVFLRPVRSRILFEQMLGRGTRKCSDIAKTHFTVFDAIGVLDYFRNASAFVSDPPRRGYRKTREIIKALFNNQDVEYNIKILVRRFQRINKNITSKGRQDFIKFIPEGNVGKFASELPMLLKKEWSETMKILTNREFLWLIENYPRAKIFIEAIDQEDEVKTEILFKTSDGRSLKPNEYLSEFEQYVKLNPDHVDALEILLQQPKQFKIESLKELRDKLAQTTQRFTEENLRKAYHFALTDIVSIIKHATKGVPLTKTEERIEKAIELIKRGQIFTPEQEEWLSLIQHHLVENILIEQGDFDIIPFSRRGGWKKANKIFEGHLPELILKINEVMLH